ncbi:MAG: hypothetical protein H6Q89_2507 [Myxococcaceae bacterium]|nr:hypothetical protein [Myxococcaceae bacterium]
MPALKLRKKPSKVSKAAKVTKARRPAKKTLKLKPAKSRKVSKARSSRKSKAKQPLPHPDQTTIRLGPHHVDRHPFPGGIRVHPAPMGAIAVKHSGMTVRHH